jgi:hypothetical protein
MASHTDLVPLIVTLGHVGDDSLQLRFPPEYSEEISQLLDEHNIDHNTAAEFSAGPVEWIEVVKVLGTAAAGIGGLGGLAAVMTAFVRRHQDKRFIFKRGDVEIDAAGYSQKAVESMLQKLPAEHAARDAETRRILGTSAEDHDSYGPSHQ